jgi:N-methylhydantoinase B
MSETVGELRGVDPVTFKIIKHRLNRVTEEAVTALKRVSGSPNTNEGHDLMMSLYTKEGELMTGGVGFLHHYIGASRATKHVIDTFGGEMEPGDAFVLNDPYTAALHPPDVYIITPIFFEGDLRAFAANFVHVTDIGAADAGGFAPSSGSVFEEGFQTPGLKLLSRGEMQEPVLDTILNMSRAPKMVRQDLRSQIAANNVATDRMQELFESYGTETVETVNRSLIERSERKFRERLASLPDGEWDVRQYIDSVAEDELFTIDLTLRKTGESLAYDFAGTSGQSEYGLNCTLWATLGGVIAPMLPLLCHDMTWNDGIIGQVDVEAPERSLVNAEHPAPISIATVATIKRCNSMSTLALSKLLGASDELDDRATAVWNGSFASMKMEIETGGETSIGSLTDGFAGAGGARAFDDGIDLGGELSNLVSRWANAERHEKELPLMYLYRRFLTDSGGAGKHRGGVGCEYAVTPVDPDADIDVVSYMHGVSVPQSSGVFGGYPGPNITARMLKGTDIEDRVAEAPAPEDIDREDAFSIQWGTNSFDTDDAFYVRLAGSGGYGDPIDREPERVVADVARGRVSPETARMVYGVPTDGDEIEGSVPERREHIRERRVRNADGASETADGQFLESTGERLSPSLAVAIDREREERVLRCADCGTVVAPAGSEWKDHVAVTDRPVGEAGAYHRDSDDVVLRKYACVDCSRLFDVEVTAPEDPPLGESVTFGADDA